MGKLNKYMMVHNNPGIDCDEIQANSLTLRFFDPRILRFFDPLIAQLFVSICIKKNSPVAIQRNFKIPVYGARIN